jgi:uncharacterized delta-60 repeat protein
MKKIILLFIVCIYCVTICPAQKPGDLDPSFGTNGLTKSDMGLPSKISTVGEQVLVQPDGSMYFIIQTAGSTLIAKKHADGTPDLLYGKNGFSALVSIFAPIALLQTDGKIILAGYFATPLDEYGDGLMMLIRFNTDGSLDRTFDGDGIQNTSGVAGYPFSGAIQADGKIIVVGAFQPQYDDYRDFIAVRYNQDGSLDNTFAANGIFRINLENDAANNVAIQHNGKIILAGGITLLRLDSDGSLDESFNGTGIQYLDFMSISIAVQQDDKILIAGTNYIGGGSDFVISRFNANGGVDNSFDGDGKQTTDFGGSKENATSIFVQPGGKIILTGNTGTTYSDNSLLKNIAIARYNSDGSLDDTYSSDGKEIIPFIPSNSYANSIAIQPDGKLLALGYMLDGTNTNLAAARYNTNSTPDNSFDGDGVLIENGNLRDTHFTSTAVQSDGKVVAAGYTWNGNNYNFAIVRYNSDGSLDKTFSGNGKQTVGFGSANAQAKAVSIQVDGKIVVAGSANNSFGLVRLNTDGTLDNTFDGDGKQTANFAALNASFIAIQADGKIVAGGSAIARYNIDGTLDLSFNGTGRVAPSFDVRDVALQNDGKIIVAGSNEVARYNNDGTPDAFANESFEDSFEDQIFVGRSVAIQSDGKILVGGYVTHEYKGGGAPSFGAVRLTTAGYIDNTFGSNGLVNSLTGFASSIEIQSDGKIILTGYSYGTNYDFTIARYDTNGNLDKSFTGDGIQITRVSSIADDRAEGSTITNSRLYVAGSAQFYGTVGVIAKYFLSENEGPAVSITSPANYAVYSASADITIIATATDADGSISYVKLYNGGTLLKTDSISPYTFALSNLSAGNYSFTARATDNNGLSASSASLAITIVAAINKAPVVSITSPLNNTIYTAPASFTINANASDVDGTINNVKFYRGGTLMGTDSLSPYSFTVSNLAPGNYSFTAKARDDKGLSTSSLSVAVSISVAANEAPLVSITSPGNNAVYGSPASFTISANASDPDGTISKVEFFNGPTLLKVDSLNPYSYVTDNLPPGIYTYTTKATDDKGKFSSSSNVTVNVLAINKAPVVNITSPANNIVYSAPASFTVNATASDVDGTISKVQFYSGATLLKTDSVAPFDYTAGNLAPGNYNYTAKATDNNALFSSSSSVTVVVKPNEKPTIQIFSLTDSSVYEAPTSFFIRSTASDVDGSISYVDFYNGSTLLQRVSVPDQPKLPFYSVTLPNTLKGSYTFIAKATDNHGGTTSSSPVHVRVIGNGILEAEDAVLNGPAVASDQPGFTGYGYADFTSASGDYVEWAVTTAAAGPFALQFRYANGGTTNRPLQLTVNGIVVNATLAFPPTGGWTTWTISSAIVNLNAGNNKIRLTTTGFNGANIDHLVVTANAGTLEAEDAVVSGAVVASAQPGYEGSGYGDYLHPSGDYIEWAVDAANAGTVSLKFRYANGSAGNRPLQLTVNGIVVNANLAFPPTGSWTTWLISSANANLVAGINTIRLTATGSSGPNVDNLSFSPNNSPIMTAQRFPPEENHLHASAFLKAYVAPNPVSGNAKLIVSASSALPITFELFDALGRRHKSLKLVPVSINTFHLPVNDLLPGSYFIVLKQGNLSTHAKFIVAKNN